MGRWFLDVHPVYQKDLDLERARKEGYEHIVIKASEGTNYVPPGFRDYVRRARAADFGLAVYHFLTRGRGDAQAAHFVKTVRSVGAPSNFVLVVDFEEYINQPARTPRNEDLKAFVAGVKRRTNGQCVVCYSGYGFWTGGNPSGDARKYRIDAKWDARYADLNKHENPQGYWWKIAAWWLRQKRWGGWRTKRIAGQFTSTGKVANLYMDVNRRFVSRRRIRRLRGKGR